LRAFSTTPYITSPNVRGKQFASVTINIRSQVGSQALILMHVLRLSPGINNGSHAGGRRAGGRIKSRGRVSNRVNAFHCRRNAADATASCRSPCGSNTATCAGGVGGGIAASAASWCPTALSVATT